MATAKTFQIAQKLHGATVSVVNVKTKTTRIGTLMQLVPGLPIILAFVGANGKPKNWQSPPAHSVVGISDKDPSVEILTLEIPSEKIIAATGGEEGIFEIRAFHNPGELEPGILTEQVYCSIKVPVRVTVSVPV